MPNPQLDQFMHAMQTKVLWMLVVCALLIVFVGIPLAWLRITAERKLIDWLRSKKRAREARKAAAKAAVGPGLTVVHCPICNSVMVKRTAQRGASAGSEFWGCPNYPKCRGTRAI
jgi:hypothetical protein